MHVFIFVSFWVSDRTGGNPEPGPASEDNCPLTVRTPERVRAHLGGRRRENQQKRVFRLRPRFPSAEVHFPVWKEFLSTPNPPEPPEKLLTCTKKGFSVPLVRRRLGKPEIPD